MSSSSLPAPSASLLTSSSPNVVLNIPVEGTHVTVNEIIDPSEMTTEYSMILACMLVPLGVMKANHKMHDGYKQNPSFKQPVMYTCPICHEDGTTHQVPPLLPCKHRFHPACLKNWFKHCSPSSASTTQRQRQQQMAGGQAQPQSPQEAFDAAAARRPFPWGPPANERPTCPVCRREMVYACGHVFNAGAISNSLCYYWHPEELKYACYGAPSRDLLRSIGPLTRSARDVKYLYGEARRIGRYDLEDNSNFFPPVDRGNSNPVASSSHNVKPTTTTTGTAGFSVLDRLIDSNIPRNTPPTDVRYPGSRDRPTTATAGTTGVSVFDLLNDINIPRNTPSPSPVVRYFGSRDNPITPQMGPLIDDHPVSWILTWATWGAKVYNAEHPFMLGLKTWDEYLHDVLQCISHLTQSPEAHDRLSRFHVVFGRLEITLDKMQRCEIELAHHERDFGGRHTDQSRRMLEMLVLRCRKSRDQWHFGLTRTRCALQHLLNCEDVHLAVHELHKLCNPKSLTARFLPWLWRHRRQKLVSCEERDGRTRL